MNREIEIEHIDRKRDEMNELLKKKFDAIREAQAHGETEEKILKLADDADKLYEEMKMINPAAPLSAAEVQIVEMARKLNKLNYTPEAAGQMNYKQLDQDLKKEADELNRNQSHKQ